MPRNASFSLPHYNPAVWNIMERGWFNILEDYGRDRIDAADLLFLLEGPSKQNPLEFLRIAAFVTGACFAPKVFEVFRCSFLNDADRTSRVLDLPSVCRIRERPSRISVAFRVLDGDSSDLFISELVLGMQWVQISSAGYRVLISDNDILNSKTQSVSVHGMLWEPGQRKPLPRTK